VVKLSGRWARRDEPGLARAVLASDSGERLAARVDAGERPVDKRLTWGIGIADDQYQLLGGLRNAGEVQGDRRT
jgi:hypothetical protein